MVIGKVEESDVGILVCGSGTGTTQQIKELELLFAIISNQHVCVVSIIMLMAVYSDLLEKISKQNIVCFFEY